MKVRLLATITATAMLAALILAATPAAAATNQVTNISVTGTCEDATTGPEGTFTGTLSLTRFTRAGGSW